MHCKLHGPRKPSRQTHSDFQRKEKGTYGSTDWHKNSLSENDSTGVLSPQGTSTCHGLPPPRTCPSFFSESQFAQLRFQGRLELLQVGEYGTYPAFCVARPSRPDWSKCHSALSPSLKTTFPLTTAPGRVI